MNRILVTGASGRVGKEVVAGLSKRFENATIVAATRDPSVRFFSIRRRRFYVFFFFVLNCDIYTLSLSKSLSKSLSLSPSLSLSLSPSLSIQICLISFQQDETKKQTNMSHTNTQQQQQQQQQQQHSSRVPHDISNPSARTRSYRLIWKEKRHGKVRWRE